MPKLIRNWMGVVKSKNTKPNYLTLNLWEMRGFVVVLLSVLWINTFCQISVTPESLERTIDVNTPEYIFDVYVNNSSTTEQSFWWKIFREEDTPIEWELFVCDLQLCYSPSVTACPPSKPNIMPADTIVKITFHVKSNEVIGEAKIWLEFYSDKNYLNLYDRTDSLGVITIASLSPVIDNDLQVSFFPNPVMDRIFITTKNPENKQLKITSIEGSEKMFSDNISTDGINVSSLSSGIYILTLKDKLTKRTDSFKFFKSN